MGNHASARKIVHELWEADSTRPGFLHKFPTEPELCKLSCCDTCDPDFEKKFPLTPSRVRYDVKRGDILFGGYRVNDLSGTRTRHGWTQPSRKRDFASLEELSWLATYPQTMVFAVELYYNMHMMRKQDLRELKILQKLENKQYQDLVIKAKFQRQTDERRQESEMQKLIQSYDADVDALNRQQKQQVEKAEVAQELDMKVNAKKIKSDQERDLKNFREGLKQELKLLKQEVDIMPKELRKDAMRRKREEKEIEHQVKEREFMESLQDSMEKSMKRLSDQHREKIALLEKQFLQQKQRLLREREASLWEMEERHLHEKHQLEKRLVKDLFFLKRHQMLNRHEKELDQVRRINDRKQADLLQRQTIEKKRLPKIQKRELKTRSQMFRASLRIGNALSIEDEKEQIRQFEEAEKKRVKSEQLRQEIKHKKQWDEMTARNNSQLRELEQLQNEKRKLLMEQENLKIKELDDEFNLEHKEWKAKLVPRKQELEEEFARQLEDQEKFYGGLSNANNGTSNSSSDVHQLPNRATTVL